MKIEENRKPYLLLIAAGAVFLLISFVVGIVAFDLTAFLLILGIGASCTTFGSIKYLDKSPAAELDETSVRFFSGELIGLGKNESLRLKEIERIYTKALVSTTSEGISEINCLILEGEKLKKETGTRYFGGLSKSERDYLRHENRIIWMPPSLKQPLEGFVSALDTSLNEARTRR